MTQISGGVMRCHDAANHPDRRDSMTESTQHTGPNIYEGMTDIGPATFDQPAWKPRHRVDPMRPANPHTDDQELEDLYQDFYQERVRSGRTGINLTLGLIVAVVALALSGVLAWLIVINYGVGQ